MIKKNMRLRLFKSLITYVILILYVLIPMLESMVCAACMGNAPYQGETTIGHLQVYHDDVIYSSKDGPQSKTPGAQDAKSFCSICCNVLMGVEVSSPNPHTIVAPYDGPHAVPARHELHYSINKPPQNLLV